MGCSHEEGAAAMLLARPLRRAPALMHGVLLQYMFFSAKFDQNISGWDVSSVTNFGVRAIALTVMCIAGHTSHPQHI